MVAIVASYDYILRKVSDDKYLSIYNNIISHMIFSFGNSI